MNKLFLAIFLGAFTAHATTPVQFNVLSFTGATDDRKLWVRAVNNPLVSGTNIYFFPAQGIRFLTTNGTYTTNLQANDYWVQISGTPNRWTISVPDTNTTNDAASLTTDVATYTYTNPLPYTITHGDSSITIATNGTVYSLTSSGGSGLTNVTDAGSTGIGLLSGIAGITNESGLVSLVSRTGTSIGYKNTVTGDYLQLAEIGTPERSGFYGGAFGFNGDVTVISNVTAATFTGDGSGLTGIASATTNFHALNVTNGVTAASFAGDGSGLTNLNAPSDLSLYTGRLILPTGDDYDTVTHPSVVVSTNNFGNYRYWMAYSGFPSAVREWTRVAASQDLVTWVSVADGNTNVVGSADLTAMSMNVGGWVADPCLFVNSNGMMVVLSMMYAQQAANITNKLVAKTSTDGTTWSSVVELEQGDTDTTVPMAGPTILQGTNGALRLYYVNDQDYATNALCYRTAVDNSGTNWNASENVCNLTVEGSSASSPWHFDIKYADDRYFICYSGQGGGAAEWAESADGVTWYNAQANALPPMNGYTEGTYKPAMWAVPGNPLRWSFIVGTYSSATGTGDAESTNRWHMVPLYNLDMPTKRFTKWLLPQDGREAGGTADPTLTTMYSAHFSPTTGWGFPVNGTEVLRYMIPMDEFPDDVCDGSMTIQVETLTVITNPVVWKPYFYYATMEADGTSSALLNSSASENIGSGAGKQVVWSSGAPTRSITTTDGFLFLAPGTSSGPITNQAGGTTTSFILAFKLTAW